MNIVLFVNATIGFYENLFLVIFCSAMDCFCLLSYIRCLGDCVRKGIFGLLWLIFDGQTCVPMAG